MTNRLKEIRESQLLTQQELADLVKMRVESICRLEKGSKHPHFSTIKALAKALKVKPEELQLRGDGNEAK